MLKVFHRESYVLYVLYTSNRVLMY